MSERSELHDAIERAIKEHCAGGDLWLCAHIASEPFDARIAELEREIERLDAQWRDELRIYRETENARIAGLEADAGHLRTFARLRFGYAPGDYFGTCHHCAKEFIGDKRAMNCEACADAAIDAARANGGAS